MDFVKQPCHMMAKPCVLTVGIDQTDQQVMNEDLWLMQRIFECLPDLVAIVDSQYRYQRVNPAYEYMYGVSRRDIEGTMVRIILGEEMFARTVKAKFDAALAGNKVSYESWVNLARIGMRYMFVTYSPLYWTSDALGEAGRRSGASVF